MTQRKQQLIASEEWDFRSLTENELYAAAEYEYARELISPTQPRKPRAWLKLAPTTRAKHVKQAGRRMGIMGSVFYGFITASPSHELEAERMIELIESDGSRRDSFGIYSWHFAQVNWGQSDKQIIADFKRWLKEARPQEVKPVIVKGKKAQSNDNSRLKWLSAYRLDAAAMSFPSAKQHIHERVGRKLNDPNDLLPRFAHASGWHAAIKKAANLIASRRA